MSAEERKKILEMVSEGKINADEAAALMRSLEEDVEDEVEVFETVSASGGEGAGAPEFEEVRRRALRFSRIFLWIGIAVTVLVAWSMLGIQQNAGINFWFLCLTMPLFLGIFLIIIGAGAKTSRWLYVDVDRTQSSDEDWPQHITLGFPLPLGIAAWALKTFGSSIRGLRGMDVNGIAEMMKSAKNMTEPLIVNVDDSDDGEKVQVYIG